MYKLPDGREVVVSSCEGLAVLLTSGEDGSQFKLQGFIELFTRTGEKEVKTLIRGKEKAQGEQYAPLVSALMGKGMSLATARNRHSDVKALWYGWNHGVSEAISNGNGWQSAVDIARNKKAADDKAAQIIADRQAVIALRDTMEQEAEAAGVEPDLVLIKETAVAEYEEVKAADAAEKKLAALEKAANKAGYKLFPLVPLLGDIALQVPYARLVEFQTYFAEWVVNSHHAEALEIAAMLATAESAKAHADNERREHQVNAVQPISNVDKLLAHQAKQDKPVTVHAGDGVVTQ